MKNDEGKQFNESDWKLFRKKLVIWQENYMDRLNEEYITLLSQEKSPSEKFWQLEKRLKSDKQKPGVIAEMKRSAMIYNIMDLLNDKVITIKDLADFSDTLKDTIHVYLSFRKQGE